MRYIEKYICSLSDDFEVHKSKKSESVYVTLDKKFTIRLSGHLPLVSSGYSLNMNIINLFNSKDFMLFMGDSHIPMVKNRDGVKMHILITYENWKMLKIKKDVEKEYDELNKDRIVYLKDCVTSEDFIKYNPLFSQTNSELECKHDIRSYIPQLKNGTSVSKEIRDFIYEKFFITDKINVADCLALVLKNIKKLKTKGMTYNIFNQFINDKDKQNENK